MLSVEVYKTGFSGSSGPPWILNGYLNTFFDELFIRLTKNERQWMALVIKTRLEQEYPTDPLDKISALQAELKLAGNF